MNIRKDIDYSAMFNAMDDVMAAGMTQMELYCELGRLICTRPEKGATVAAAEHFKNRYQDVNGFSPRNMRRMRDFYRVYGEHSDLLALSLKIGWTQNVIILEADLNMDERRWYLRATAQFGWSKAELKQKIDSASHLEIDLDESANTCYTESKNTNLEPTTHEQDTFYLSWEYLQKPDGRVCNEGLGEESRAGEQIPDRVSSYKYRGNWQSGLSPARRKLAEHGINCSGKRARQLLNSDYEKYDLLIGMDNANLRSMYKICGGDFADKMHLLMDFTDHPGEVADPWYTDDFEETWQNVLAGCQGLLETLNPPQ